MSLATIKLELGIKGSLSKYTRESNSFKEKVIKLLELKHSNLKTLNSNIAVTRHKISKAKIIYSTIEEYEKDWEKKKDFNSPYQVAFRNVAIAKSEYWNLMKEKKSLKKDIEILNSFIENEQERNSAG